jgi:hypothetical protein
VRLGTITGVDVQAKTCLGGRAQPRLHGRVRHPDRGCRRVPVLLRQRGVANFAAGMKSIDASSCGPGYSARSNWHTCRQTPRRSPPAGLRGGQRRPDRHRDGPADRRDQRRGSPISMNHLLAVPGPSPATTSISPPEHPSLCSRDSATPTGAPRPSQPAPTPSDRPTTTAPAGTNSATTPPSQCR